MYKFIHWYNQNKKIFWKITGIIVAIILVIQLANGAAKIKNKTNQENPIIVENKNEDKFNEITLKDNKSVITGNQLSTNQTNKLDVLDEFVEYCNNKQIDKAYNLISDDCKKDVFKTKEEFQRIYYDKIFAGKVKNISVENWVRNIYKVKFMEDALSTGIYDAGQNVQDYITIIEDEEDNIKLNINGYIEKEEISESKDAFNLKINVVERNQYMDYEIYEFEITNSSRNTVMLNDIENMNTIYLKDENNLKYYAYMNELSEAQLRVLPGETKKVSIKYYSKYSSTKEITSIVFSEINLGGNEIATFEIQL